MNRATTRQQAFTIIELLVTIAIIALLTAILIPSMGKARSTAKSLTCLAHLRELSNGFSIYADNHNEMMVPMRPHEAPGGKSNSGNWYAVGNGQKFRPRWAAIIGAVIGAPPFQKPLTEDAQINGLLVDAERQDYDHEVYTCPEVADWVDERNSPYGYNYQFLGNSRKTNDRYHNFPVLRHRVSAPAETILVADAMGTAAGFALRERLGYSNNGKAAAELGNHGYTLDPPRLTKRSDHGTGSADSRRSAVDPRHRGRVNAIYLDSHAATRTDEELGYRKHDDGRYVDLDEYHNAQKGPPDNRFFSGSGKDVTPPDRPE